MATAPTLALVVIARFLHAGGLIDACAGAGAFVSSDVETSRLLDEAVASGERSDDVWDEAAAQVQSHLCDLGEPTVTWLPGGTPVQSP